MPTIFAHDSYRCVTCPLTFSIDPTDSKEIVRHFPECPDLASGMCPACWMRDRTESAMELLKESAITTEVATDEEIAAKTVEATDDNGQTIMVESDRTTLSIGIVDGKPAVVETPILEPQMRDLTDDELTELKQQRDQNLDALESVALKEVTLDQPEGETVGLI
jgi:hypothetical protein